MHRRKLYRFACGLVFVSFKKIESLLIIFGSNWYYISIKGMKKQNSSFFGIIALVVASIFLALIVPNHSASAIGYKNWPEVYRSSWKIKTLKSSELQLITKYYPSPRGNSTNSTDRQNDVGTN